MTEDPMTVIKAAPDTKAATTTPNSHPGDTLKLYHSEATTGRINPIRDATMCVKHTAVPRSSHLVPSTVVLTLELASESPGALVKAQMARIHLVSDSVAVGLGAQEPALLTSSQVMLMILSLGAH